MMILGVCQPMLKDYFKQKTISFTASILLASSIFGCTPSTGIGVSQTTFDKTAYKDEGMLYIYRKKSFGGAIAKMWVEVNNRDVGTLGMEQTMSVQLQNGANLIGVSSDLNQRSYNYLMNVKSREPRYLVASYGKSLLVELDFDEWVKTIVGKK